MHEAQNTDASTETQQIKIPSFLCDVYYIYVDEAQNTDASMHLMHHQKLNI